MRRGAGLGVVARRFLPLLQLNRELLAIEALERHAGADAVALVVAAERVALAVDAEARLGVAEQRLPALRRRWVLLAARRSAMARPPRCGLTALTARRESPTRRPSGSNGGLVSSATLAIRARQLTSPPRAKWFYNCAGTDSLVVHGESSVDCRRFERLTTRFFTHEAVIVMIGFSVGHDMPDKTPAHRTLACQICLLRNPNCAEGHRRGRGPPAMGNRSRVPLCGPRRRRGHDGCLCDRAT